MQQVDVDMMRFDSSTLLDVLRLPGDGNVLDFEELGELLGEDDPLQLVYAPHFEEIVEAKPEVPGTSAVSGATGAEQLRPSSSGEATNMMGDSSDQNYVPPAGRSNGGTSQHRTSNGGTQDASAGGALAKSGVKKRRMRNNEQMEMNRAAQQKYRERKKFEYESLQTAVEVLTAQLAALKAVEVRNGELEATNSTLVNTVHQQGAAIAALETTVQAQSAELGEVKEQLRTAQSMVASQATMILDQHTKLRLQEQIIASMKDRLKDAMDEALTNVVPGTVCEKLIAAVKTAIYGAKNMHGVQVVLEQLPEHLVVEICKNILHVCKEMWPDFSLRCHQQCTQQRATPSQCS